MGRLSSGDGNIMNEDDLIETIREDELSRPGRFWGFSENFSKFVFLVDSSTVAELDAESIGRFQEVIMEEMGFAGYFRTIGRKLAGKVRGLLRGN